MIPPRQTANFNDAFSRRTFLKTSSLSVGAFSLLSRGTALANGSTTPPPCQVTVSASPDSAAYYSPILSDEGHSLKIKVVTTPPGGPADKKTLVLQVEGWKDDDYAGTVKFSDPLTVTGEIIHNSSAHSPTNCVFVGGKDDPAAGGFDMFITESDPVDTINMGGGVYKVVTWTYSASVIVTDSAVIPDVEAYITVQVTLIKEKTYTTYDPSSGTSTTYDPPVTFPGSRIRQIRAWKS